MILSRESLQRILRGVGYGASVVVPCFLLLDRQSHFQQDWPNHLWIIDFYGAYFRQHGALPEFMNGAQAVGMALPVFYGWLLYPAMGILAAGIGLMPAVSLAVFGLILVQFLALMSAGRRVFDEPRMPYVVASSVIWGTYSLTNLYNRGALAEYFATGFVVTAIGYGTVAAFATSGPVRWFHGWLAGLFLLLAVGAHPPTAVLTAIFLALLGVGWVMASLRGGSRISAGAGWVLAGGALVGAVILAPWVYACALFGDKLHVARHYAKFVFRPDHSDTFWARFAPFPYDVASAVNGIHSNDTPFLEAPVNMVLLGILLWNFELCRRGSGRLPAVNSTLGNRFARVVLIVSAGWFGLLTATSLSPGLASTFEFLAPSIQFIYRLVSHCNAALLVAVYASGTLAARQGGYRRHRHQTKQILAAGLAVALLGLGLKLQHASAVSVPGVPVPPSIGQQLALANAYTTPSIARALPEADGGDAPLLMFAGRTTPGKWNEIAPLHVGLKQAAWLRTNALVFPWLEMTSDGVKLPAAQVAREGPFYAIYVPAGRHELRPVWRPDPVWSRLHGLSQAVFALVLLFTAVWAALRLLPRRGRAIPT